MTHIRPAPIGAVLSLVAMVAATPALAVIDGTMVTYVNARYGYSIQYPYGVFTPEPESASGDGRVFHSRYAGVEFRVWANYAGQTMTPTQLADEIQADCPGHRASYRVARATLVAVSCNTATGVLYEKELINKGLVTAFRMTYPSTEGAQWGPVVTAIAGSMRAGKG